MEKIVNKVLKKALGAFIIASLFSFVDTNATKQTEGDSIEEDSSIQSILPQFKDKDEKEAFADKVRAFYGQREKVKGEFEDLKSIMKEKRGMPICSSGYWKKGFASLVLDVRNGSEKLIEGFEFGPRESLSNQRAWMRTFLWMRSDMKAYVENAMQRLKETGRLDEADEAVFKKFLLDDDFIKKGDEGFVKDITAEKADALRGKYFRTLFRLNNLVIEAVRDEEETRS